MQRFTFEPVTQNDHEEILSLFRMPMGGSISLALERDPDYFAGAAVQNQSPAVYVGRDRESGRLTGLFSVGTRPVYVNGKPEEIPYFCDLRIHPDYRRGTLLARGYRFVKEELLKERYAQTIIVSDNLPALEALTGGRAGLPVYYPYGRYVTFALAPISLKCTSNARRATAEEKAEIAAFLAVEGRSKQFYPVYNLDLQSPYYRGIELRDYFVLRESGQITGILGVWNQKDFKRSRLAAYSPLMRIVRPLYNAYTGIRGGIRLPPAGSVLKYSFLHSLAVKDNDPARLSSLLEAVFSNRSKESEYFLLGLDASDPLVQALKGIPCRTFHGMHFLVAGGRDPRPDLLPGPFYLEAARI